MSLPISGFLQIPLTSSILGLNELLSALHVVIKVEAGRSKAMIATSSDTSGPTADNPPPPVVCSDDGGTSIKSALRRAMSNRPPSAETIR
jgi:hypothetical protein